MFQKESIPFAPMLIESMRSLGYSFESAIADIIDNSISAKATRIDLFLSPEENPYLIIFDNGIGMNEKEIEEAMRYGSKNPLEKRAKNDLGRFGLGLKSASLSQCRKLTVVSKKENNLSSFSWDLDYIKNSQSWKIIGYDLDEINKLPKIELFNSASSGTYVLLEEFDRVKSSTKNLNKTLTEYMIKTKEHLSLVFHRYLEGNLDIYINNSKIRAKDPFLSKHKKTQCKREQSFIINGSKIVVKPYILPYINYLTNEDIKKVGSKEQFRNEQGFYIYRNKRLIIWGTWFRMETKNELSKLARIRVDIPNSLDYMWNIDIKKSSANLPDIIKNKLHNCIKDSVVSSETVHQYRGRKQKPNSDITYIWDRIKIRNGYEYKINREIPQLKLLRDSLDEKQTNLLEKTLRYIEENFPVDTLYIDMTKGDISSNQEKNKEDLEFKKLYEDILLEIEFAKKYGMNEKNFIRLLMKSEPYCNNSLLLKKMGELLDYE
ncbi:ATP-binding protein [Intestinibacter bartlettii]|uniref:ATP-binding protein n=1 Tax=Intestinibacter bartlettii TaxID=261299 RepID=UPI0039F54C74